MFEKNLISYKKNNDLGKCPNCGGTVKLTEMKVPHRINLIISCLKCKKEEMFLGTYNPYRK
jgi:C4-type Zn-finger protein